MIPCRHGRLRFETGRGPTVCSPIRHGSRSTLPSGSIAGGGTRWTVGGPISSRVKGGAATSPFQRPCQLQEQLGLVPRGVSDRVGPDGAPTWSPRNAQEEWSGRQGDRNFIKAWGDSSPLERGRVMPNECWLRCEAPLDEGEADPCTVRMPSTVFGLCGGTRKDVTLVQHEPTREAAPCGPPPHLGTNPAPGSTSATGSYLATSRRSRNRVGTYMRPVGYPKGVAPFGVSAVTRLAHTNRAFSMSEDCTYEVQETDGAIGSNCERLTPPLGTGAPTLFFLNRLRVAANEVMDVHDHHVSRGLVTRRGTDVSRFSGW